jgi:hypothetical protein
VLRLAFTCAPLGPLELDDAASECLAGFYSTVAVCPVSWLNLHLHIPQKDIRKLIYALRSPEDREVVACAHNKQRVPDLTEDFAFYSTAPETASSSCWTGLARRSVE